VKPTEVVKDKKVKDMFRLKWPDGVLSEDFYNLARANDILKNYAEYRNNMTKADRPSLIKARSVKQKRSYSDLK
jgi:hypothetical protein